MWLIVPIILILAILLIKNKYDKPILDKRTYLPFTSFSEFEEFTDHVKKNYLAFVDEHLYVDLSTKGFTVGEAKYFPSDTFIHKSDFIELCVACGMEIILEKKRACDIEQPGKENLLYFIKGKELLTDYHSFPKIADENCYSFEQQVKIRQRITNQRKHLFLEHCNYFKKVRSLSLNGEAIQTSVELSPFENAYLLTSYIKKHSYHLTQSHTFSGLRGFKSPYTGTMLENLPLSATDIIHPTERMKYFQDFIQGLDNVLPSFVRYIHACGCEMQLAFLPQLWYTHLLNERVDDNTIPLFKIEAKPIEDPYCEESLRKKGYKI